jgi:hypothetical protein
MSPLAPLDTAKLATSNQPLSPDEVRQIDAYWRAANYLSVGQIYLLKNPLLREPLKIEHVKPRLLGHWGTTPGLNFIYAHFNRIIKKYNLNVINITGPGHGGPGIVANAYLEGTTRSSIPTFSRAKTGCESSLSNSLFPAEFQATPRRRPLARSTKAVNSDTVSHMPSGRSLTILICWPAALLETARPKLGRSRPVGIPTSF